MSETRSTFVPIEGATGNEAMVGRVLGNYRILSKISTGGMGAVYRARHEILGRSAAVKLLRPELTANEELVDRFFNEAKAASAIRHPGIVEVYDFGYTEDGLAYLVMELLEGQTLSDALEAVGRFTELEVASIGRGIANALKAAHAKGIVHRDLKPDNVFLVPDLEGPTNSRRAKVLDFGIAKLVETAPSSPRHTQTGALMGTPLYMAPEQARAAGSIDHRADLYSLGCILYELLVGQPPFVAEGAGEIIALQLFAEPEPPSARLAHISPEMERIVLRLLAKEPHERFQSAAEVVSALTVAGRLSQELSAALPASGAHPQLRLSNLTPIPTNKLRLSLLDEAGPPPRPKHGAMPIIAGAVTLVLAVAVIVLVATRQSGDEGKPPDEPAKSNPIAKPDVPVKPDVPTKQDLGPSKVELPIKRPEPPLPLKIVGKRPPPTTNRKPDKTANGTPVTHPDPGPTGPVTTPHGPITDTGAPIETTLDDNKKKQP